MRTFVIAVTATDIKNGEPSNAKACPIALAIKRAGIRFPSKFIGVGYYDIGLNGGATVPLPLAAQEFIDKFDHREKVKPFGFKIKF